MRNKFYVRKNLTQLRRNYLSPLCWKLPPHPSHFSNREMRRLPFVCTQDPPTSYSGLRRPAPFSYYSLVHDFRPYATFIESNFNYLFGLFEGRWIKSWRHPHHHLMARPLVLLCCARRPSFHSRHALSTWKDNLPANMSLVVNDRTNQSVTLKNKKEKSANRNK